VLLALAALALLAVPAVAQSLSGDQILEKIDEHGGIGGMGSQVSFLSFTIVDKTGARQEEFFASFSKGSADPTVPNRNLILFLAPPAETCGTIFLSIDRKVVGEKPELYLFLPAIGQVKQIVTTSERKGSFAGSNIQFDQIGQSQLHTDFTATLVGEDTVNVSVDGVTQDRRVYVLDLAVNKESVADESYPERRVWVDEDAYVVLRSEGTNTVGKLELVTTVDGLVTFKGGLQPSLMVVQNVLDQSSTTVTISDREDVGELADSLFDPGALAQFDPRQFNDRLTVKIPDPVCP